MKIKKNKVIIIDKRYVVKQDSIERLKAEKVFIEENKKIKVERIIDSNINEKYNVYEYIDGNTINYLRDVDNCIAEIYNIIDLYSKAEIDGYGDIFDLRRSWTDFLREDIVKQSKYMEYSKIELLDKVMNKISILEEYPINKKIIHGDLGCFNIICKEKKIVGIIDPRTIIGDPLYDFIYFIFSNYNIAKEVDIYEILNILNEPKEKIFAMFYIMLYDRIAREHKNNTPHKNDFFTVWNKIKKIEENY